MKKLTFLIVGLGLSFSASSQIHYNLEAGGSNFLGLGLNISYSIYPTPEKPFYIAPQIGIGKLFLYDMPVGFQFGLAFGIDASESTTVGLSSSATYFLTDPYRNSSYISDFNHPWQYGWSNTLDIRFIPGKKIRYTIGAGVVMSITRYTSDRINVGEIYKPVLKLGIGI